MLKDQLLLTTEEIHKAVVAIEKDQAERRKKKWKKGRKRKAADIESDSDEASIVADSDPILPPERYECITVLQR